MLDWDDEVDVVCVGGGVAALASAIAAVDADAEVYVAAPKRDGPGSASTLAATWLGTAVSDPETHEYFAALSEDLPAVSMVNDAVVPVCEVMEAPPFDRRRQIEPFIGSRLRDWTGHCLGSPYGLLHTRVSDWGMSAMRTPRGDVIEAKVIGTWRPGRRLSGRSIAEWLTVEADDREIEVHAGQRFQRLVFEEGDVVGAVLATPWGLRSIRARHGVTMTPAVTVDDTTAPLGLRQYQRELRIGLVSQTASRFSRLEILSAAPTDH